MPLSTRDIGTDLLRTLIFVVEERSYTKAANRLGLSQPTVSAHIKRLQDQLGYEIFDKSVPGVTLTARGEFVLARARQMLTLHEQLLHYDATHENDGRRIRIGVPDDMLTLVSAISAMRREDPSAIFQVTRGTSAKLMEQYKAGEIDVCVIFSRSGAPDGADLYGQDTFVWAGLDRDSVLPEPVNIIAPPVDCLSYELMLEALETHGVKYRIVVQAGVFTGAINGAAAGLGVIGLLRSRIPAPLKEIGPDKGLPPTRTPVYWGIYVGPNARGGVAERLADYLAGEIRQQRLALAASGGR